MVCAGAHLIKRKPVLKRTPSGNLVHCKEVPEWLDVNPHVSLMHRPPLYSYKACLLSIFQLHAETCNIWTHLMAFFVYLYTLARFFLDPSRHNFTGNHEWCIHLLHLLCSATGFLMSCVYHTFNCHSNSVKCASLKMDLYGITTMLFGLYIPYIYYSVYCEPVAWVVYTILACIGTAMAFHVFRQDKYTTDGYRMERTGILGLMSLGSVGIFAHVVSRRGIILAWVEGHQWYVYLAAMLIIGTAFLINDFPERIWSGSHDLLIHSHPIFHVFSFLASFSMTIGFNELHQIRLSHGQC